MFTGLILSTATVSHVAELEEGRELRFDCDTSALNASIGASISVDGVCSTVIELTDSFFTVQYLPETLDKTTLGLLNRGDTVNLEPSLTMSTPMGGHFVTGHVDCVGKVASITQADPWGELKIVFPESCKANVVYKGSICISGISLTVASVRDNCLTCHIIPHTFENTNLGKLKPRDSVNLEFDMLGKYVLRAIECGVTRHD